MFLQWLHNTVLVRCVLLIPAINLDRVEVDVQVLHLQRDWFLLHVLTAGLTGRLGLDVGGEHGACSTRTKEMVFTIFAFEALTELFAHPPHDLIFLVLLLL